MARVLLNYRGARRAMVRRAVFEAVGAGSPLVAAQFGRGRLLVDARDREIGPVVYATGNYERVYMAAALKELEKFGLVRPDSTFVDIGANIGTSTIDALLHFGFGRAVCFEPDPRNCKLLRLNLLLNDLEERATVYQAAASNRDAARPLLRSPDNRGDNRLVSSGSPTGRGGIREDILTVECRRLDSLAQEDGFRLADVGLLWIDVQGHESFVLEGASMFLEEGVPTVVEYAPTLLRQNECLESFEQIVREHYGVVIDLRLVASGLSSRAAIRASDLHTVANRLSEREHTDLLLLRVDSPYGMVRETGPRARSGLQGRHTQPRAASAESSRRRDSG